MQKTVVFVDEAAAPVAARGGPDPWFRKAHRRNRAFIASMATALLALVGLAAWFILVA